MSAIFGKILDKMTSGGGGHRQRYPVPIIAPVGYDPTTDPDGSQLAALVGRQAGGGGGGAWSALWENMRSIWWVFAIIVVMAAWGWYWWGVRPARAAARAAATATVVAASWTPTVILTAAPAPPAAMPIPTMVPTFTRMPAPIGVTRIAVARPTETPTSTPTWTPPPTGTATPTETPTPTPTWTSPVQPPSAPATSSAPGSAQLAATTAQAGDSMVVTGYVSNGSVVRLLWEDGKTLLGQGTPGLAGSFAIPFVVPGHIPNGYHVIYVVWSAGKSDHVIPLVLSINVPPPPTPTWTPVPLPTSTPTITPTPTRTPTPFPTPVGGWPCRVYLPLLRR